MRWMGLCCAGSANRSWTAWIPAAVLLILITVQLLERASEGDASGADTADTGRPVIGDER